MRLLEYTVPADCGGMTLRDFTRRRLGFSARAFSEQKQTENGILRNGTPCRARDILRPGDILTFALPEEQADYPAEPVALSVLWETEDYLAVDKPIAMPVHPSPGHDRDSLLNAVSYHYKQTGQSHLFRPLYRLDRNTSGILVLAKHRVAALARLEKTYFAVCEGELSGSGTVEAPIGLAEGSKIRRECGHGEPAVTHWQALGSAEGHTLLACRLETGRTHQIRVHMAHLGHPLAGDDLYGGSRERLSRQALHCGSVSLACPALNVETDLHSPLPADLLTAFPWLNDYKEELLCLPV